jgi:hypothetical protein
MRTTSLGLAAFLLIAACGGKTLVDGDSTKPGGDGGASTERERDAGGSTTDSSRPSCVTINVSNYDTACAEDTDCISVNVGRVCTGACLCGGGGAISASDQAEYNAALSSIQTDDTCPCLDPGPAACVQGQCTQCRSGPDNPPGCPGNTPEGGLEVDTGVVSTGGDSGVIVVHYDAGNIGSSSGSNSGGGDSGGLAFDGTTGQACMSDADCVSTNPDAPGLVQCSLTLFVEGAIFPTGVCIIPPTQAGNCSNQRAQRLRPSRPGTPDAIRRTQVSCRSSECPSSIFSRPSRASASSTSDAAMARSR